MLFNSNNPNWNHIIRICFYYLSLSLSSCAPHFWLHKKGSRFDYIVWHAEIWLNLFTISYFLRLNNKQNAVVHIYYELSIYTTRSSCTDFYFCSNFSCLHRLLLRLILLIVFVLMILESNEFTYHPASHNHIQHQTLIRDCVDRGGEELPNRTAQPKHVSDDANVIQPPLTAVRTQRTADNCWVSWFSLSD